MEIWRQQMHLWAVLEALRHAEEALGRGDAKLALSRVQDAYRDTLLVYDALRPEAGLTDKQTAAEQEG